MNTSGKMASWNKLQKSKGDDEKGQTSLKTDGTCPQGPSISHIPFIANVKHTPLHAGCVAMRFELHCGVSLRSCLQLTCMK